MRGCRRTAVRFVLAVLAFAGAACEGKKPPAPVPQPAPPAAVSVLGQVPEFILLDETGRAFGSEDLLGKVWVADFIFTKCSGVCVPMTERMAKIQGELGARQGWGDVKLVSFTVDPEYDRPSVLAAYANACKADGGRWKFLTGTRDAIWRLSKDGMKLPVGEAPPGEAAMPIFHSQKLVLVDRDGRIRGYFEGATEAGWAELAKTLDLVVAEAPAVAIPFPAEVLNPPWLGGRREAQLKSAPGVSAFHEFGFTDRIAESGITFRHHVVDDAAKDFRANHYDHGNGLAVADVDGDDLVDLFFVNQLGESELWRNLGDGKFANATAAAGISQGGRIGSSASFADIDNDGDADLFVTTIRGGNLLFENDGQGRFKEIGRAAGVDYSGHSGGAIFFDYDRDGLLDLWVCNIGKFTIDRVGRGGYHIGVPDGFAGHLKPDRDEASILYRNMGGNVFKDVTRECGLVEGSWNGDAVAIDLNEDGFLDLYLTNMQGMDQYFENKGGKEFVRKSAEVFPRTPWGSTGVEVLDADGDGLLDIFVTDMHTDMAPPRGIPPGEEKQKLPIAAMFPRSFLQTDADVVLGNALFRNQGRQQFTEISEKAGVETYWPWGPSAGDLNADGYDDLFVTAGMSYPFRYGVNSLLLNNAGAGFSDAEFIVGVEPRRGGRTAKPVFELDCGGADKAHPRRPAGVHDRAVVWGAHSTRGSAIVDLDNDGDLDIVTGEFNDFPQVLVSDLAARRSVHFLKLRLTGSKSNRAGIGARVALKVGSRTIVQSNDGKSGYMAQSSGPLYFGLGEATRVDSVEIVWPSGIRQVVEGPIEGNRLVHVTEK